MNLIPEIDRFILLINETAIFTLSLYISFYRGSQYGLRNEKSAYLNHLLHDNTDNLQELNRKGVLFFKFELNKNKTKISRIKQKFYLISVKASVNTQY